MLDIRYVREILSGAIDALSGGNGPLRERLSVALTSLEPLQAADMPTETMQNDFAILMEEMSEARAEGRNDPSSTALSAADDLELQDMAQLLVGLHKASIASEVRGDSASIS